MEEQWRPRRPTITVIDISSSYQAISLTFSAIETVLKYLVVFLLSILYKIVVRRKRCNVTAACGGPRELIRLKKGPTMQVRSFVESKNVMNLL
jgi:hypothetical protein